MKDRDAKPYLREIRLDRDGIADWDVYPFDIPVVSGLRTLTLHPDVTFFTGENGSGKSTLLEAIALAMGFSQEGGTRNMRGHSADTVSQLQEFIQPVRSHRQPRDFFFLRAESLYNLATRADELGYLGGYGGTSLHARSHGEAFLAVLNHKLRGNGFYILDEPEAALSATGVMSALASIHRLVLDGSQFIIATHSPILLAYPRSKILRFDESGLREVRYEETDSFMLTRRFLNDYKRIVEDLVAPD